jgi:hypothetical protein
MYVSVNLVDERRLTFDGSAVIFNGMPDWIYEGIYFRIQLIYLLSIKIK